MFVTIATLLTLTTEHRGRWHSIFFKFFKNVTKIHKTIFKNLKIQKIQKKIQFFFENFEIFVKKFY
jgi:hypothetical protein